MKTIEQFYNEHYEYILGIIQYKLDHQHKHAAQDLAHDVILRVIKNYDNYDGKNDKGWLGFIINSVTIDFWRTINRKGTLPLLTGEHGEYYPIKDRDIPYEDVMIKEEELKELEGCLDLLNEDFIGVVKEVILGDLTHKQYAEKANISINTSLGRARYSIKALKKMMVKQ